MAVAWDVPDNLPAYGVGTAIPAPGLPPAGSHPLAALPPTTDYSLPVVILGRLKPGSIRETRRVVHVVPLVPGTAHATTVTARCGEQLPVADTQWLPTLIGMPCEHCVLQSVDGDQPG